MSHLYVRDNNVPLPNTQQEPRSVVNDRQHLKRRIMMFNVKRVFLTTALVISGALVAPFGAMATPASVSFITPAGNAGCTMNGPVGKYLTLTPNDVGGWPKTFFNQTGGTSYEFSYIVSTNVSTPDIKVVLNAKLPTPVTSNGTTANPYPDPPCKGNLSTDFAENVCDVRVASLLPGSASGTMSIFMHDISAHAPGGGAAAKYGFTLFSGCSPLEVPIAAPPAFASVPKIAILPVNGVDYCLPLGPSGCPLNGTTAGTAPYLCSDNTKTPLPEITLTITDNLGSHTLTWAQSSKDDPTCPYGILAGNATSCYITSGGRTYKVC